MGTRLDDISGYVQETSTAVKKKMDQDTNSTGEALKSTGALVTEKTAALKDELAVTVGKAENQTQKLGAAVLKGLVDKIMERQTATDEKLTRSGRRL